MTGMLRASAAGLVVLMHGIAACGSSDCGAVPTFADAAARQAEVFVSPSGSDVSGDGSRGAPYATIARGVAAASAGTAVRLLPGDYPGGTFIVEWRGSASAPLWLGGVEGEARPRIVGGGEGLHFIRCAYVVVERIEVVGAANNGVNCDDGGDRADPLATQHMLFRDLYIHDIGGTGNQDGLKLSGLNDFVVDRCRIERCGGAGSGSGIDQVGCHRGVVARTEMRDTAGSGVQLKGGTEDVEVRWCRIENGGERPLNIGGSTGFEFFRPPLSTTEPNFEARNIRAYANVIVGGRCAVAFVGAVECVAAQNTIVAPASWAVRILQETTSSGEYVFLESGDNALASNIVYFSRADVGASVVNIGPNTRPETFTFSHDLWYAQDDPGQSAPNLPTAPVAPVIGEDPRFVDVVAGNFQLLAGSAAAGAGAAPARIGGDYHGYCYGSPPAIGAFAERPAPPRGQRAPVARRDANER